MDEWPNCPEIISMENPARFKTVENECLAKIVVGTLSSFKTPAIHFMYLLIVFGKSTSIAKGINSSRLKVLGGKYLVDPGRPDNAEIRYFNAGDKEQAENSRIHAVEIPRSKLYT